jgi:putative endonuclease
LSGASDGKPLFGFPQIAKDALRSSSQLPRARSGGGLIESPVRTVYLLRSIPYPKRKYVGSTVDLPARLEEHNAGKSPHTKIFMPWKIEVAIQFRDDRKALAFEKYLKAGSGHAFANRHLW